MSQPRDRIVRRIDQALGRAPADLVLRGGRILNVASGELAEGDVAVCGDRIVGTYERYEGTRELDVSGKIVAPGLIDTHLHVESTLVTPAEFTRCALPRGTTTAICDPHEISNVLGVEGLRYFLAASEQLPVDLRVQLSSCVPATDLETSGARLRAADLLPHRDHPQVLGLAEFMNYPGIFSHDPEVLDKLVAFEGAHIDGHCPLVTGRELNAYLACGIRNCHESTSLEEAREKLRKGMQVLIREGTVSKDVDALAPLLDATTWPFLAFCTDDRNPLDIAEEGHLDYVLRKAMARGAPPIPVYRAATWGAATGFGLRDRGLVAPGYRADLIVISELEACDVQTVVAGGRLVDEALLADIPEPEPPGLHSVKLEPIAPELLEVPAQGPAGPVIGLLPGKLITEKLRCELPVAEGRRLADPARDLLKVCVLARHGVNRNVGRGFVRGFGLRGGAIASSVGHDSHNLIVVGGSDAEMARAINRLIELQGGFVVVRGERVLAELALPVAGLMSRLPQAEVAEALARLRAAAVELGCPLADPFLQLAFLPLPVIPHLKITDRGLVDVDRFELVAA